MPTVNSRDVVDTIIKGNGYYPGDELRVMRIVQYNNKFNGGIAYGLIYEGMPLDVYHKAVDCHNPTTIWDAVQDGT